MPANYIPAPDADFDNWQDNFVTYANAHLVALGLVAGDMTPVVTAQNSWKVVYPAHLTAVLAASSAKVVKDASRAVEGEGVGIGRGGCQPYKIRGIATPSAFALNGIKNFHYWIFLFAQIEEVILDFK